MTRINILHVAINYIRALESIIDTGDAGVHVYGTSVVQSPNLPISPEAEPPVEKVAKKSTEIHSELHSKRKQQTTTTKDNTVNNINENNNSQQNNNNSNKKSIIKLFVRRFRNQYGFRRLRRRYNLSRLDRIDINFRIISNSSTATTAASTKIWKFGYSTQLNCSQFSATNTTTTDKSQ